MTQVALIGAGLVGSLLAIFLARRGLFVDLYERRPDMRTEKVSAGRSINLAISVRGINALEQLNLDKDILQAAVPMKGRMMHSPEGRLTFQPYGTDENDYINSISRATLNKELMTAAEATQKVKIFFNQRAADIDFDAGIVTFHDEREDRTYTKQYDLVIGTDGSASAVRNAMMRLPEHTCSEQALDYGYKELVILPTESGAFKLERNALHIWPRGSFMLIALPNFEGSFTCTLFLPWEGPVSFQHLNTPEQILEFFNKYFQDAVPLIDNLVETFQSNPTGHMVTVKTMPWNVDGRCLLVGDAAHGIVPFFGQGMNCGFEDCFILDQILNEADDVSTIDWSHVFGKLVRMRKENTDAIADMAVENFVEMRDKVADQKFLLAKAVEKILQKEFPGRYVGRYALVTFSNVPYKLAYDAGVVCDGILDELTRDIEKPESVDLSKAEKLIDARLVPILEPYRNLLARFTEANERSKAGI